VEPEEREFAQGLKLAAVAIASAVLVAALVIGLGDALLRRLEPARLESALLMRTTG
jgi:hypothetical protein